MKQCIACGGRNFASYSASLIQCGDCGLVVAKRIPSTSELNDLYQREYFFGKEYFNYENDRPALERNFRNRMKTLAPYLTSTSYLVEIGCAYGYFLNLARSRVGGHRGFDVSREGVEFSRKNLGVNATNENFLEAEIIDMSVDIVCMWDVIEHLAAPNEFIEKIGRILKPGGCLALTTGDISGLVPRLRGEKWRMIHPPTHLFYFSPSTLGRLLRRYGLRPVVVKHPLTYRNLGSVVNQIRLNRLALGKSVVILEYLDRFCRKAGAGKLNIPLNTFDIMEVVAVKQ